jgi:uroporphyrinogen-III decarboxylase
MEEKYRQQYRLYASLGYDLLYCTDDTSTTTISPAMFEEFCMGYTDRMADAVHEYGVRYVHHSCGWINNLLDLYRQTRMDAVDALCLKPIGDVNSLAEARAKLGPKITILAPLVQICGSLDDRAAVAESIAQMFRDVAPGDNITFGIAGEPTKNMEAHAFIAQECRKHQRRFAEGK